MRLELRSMTKIFGPLVTNDYIDLAVEPGEIHALLGENGAGKSALMNVLYGLYKPDAGEVLIDRKPATFKGPGDAVAAGIGMVYQRFMLVPVFTVAESVALGYESTKGVGTLDLDSVRRKVRGLSAKFGFDIDPDSLIEDLPAGAQQRVEIIKALSREAKMLVLNEPMAVLTPQETDGLIEITCQPKASGTSTVFIIHKLHEVKAVAEEITATRWDKVVGYAKPESTDSEPAAVMVGHEVELTVEKAEPELDDMAFEMKQAMTTDETGQVKLDHIDLEIRSGEISVIAGVQGNDQTELCRTILGLQSFAGGSMSLASEGLSKLKMEIRLGRQLGYVPEDRSTDGMIASFSITEDVIFDWYDRSPFATKINTHSKVVVENVEELREGYDVWVTSTSDMTSTLSGSDQQKTTLARELSRPLKLLVTPQPVCGLDVDSIEFVYKRIVEQRGVGIGVILISTELDEVVGLIDRVAVMYRRKAIGIVPPDTSRDALGPMMAGIPLEE